MKLRRGIRLPVPWATARVRAYLIFLDDRKGAPLQCDLLAKLRRGIRLPVPWATARVRAYPIFLGFLGDRKGAPLQYDLLAKLRRASACRCPGRPQGCAPTRSSWATARVRASLIFLGDRKGTPLPDLLGRPQGCAPTE